MSMDFGQSLTNGDHAAAKEISVENSCLSRRRSPRLKTIRQSKMPYYGTSSKGQEALQIWSDKEDSVSDSDVTSVDTCSTTANEGDDRQSSGSDTSKKKRLRSFTSSSGGDEKSAHEMAKKTIRTFNSFYLQLLQEEETLCKKLEVDIQEDAKDLKQKRKSNLCEELRGVSRQLDVKALSKMFATNAIMYPRKRFGHFPGIDVGYQFHSRAEMVALGFHSHCLYRIDYMGNDYSKMAEYKGFTFPLAVAIVSSGQCEDNQYDLEDIIHTGQVDELVDIIYSGKGPGGEDHINIQEVNNQATSHCNLALKNNMDQEIPIRVVSGHNSSSSYSGKVYTYDGLYKVIECWARKEVSGFLAYKYRLRRLGGQPKLMKNQVYFTEEHKVKVSSKLPGMVCVDISDGQEEISIPAINLIDDAPFVCSGFTYSKSIQVAENVNLPPNADGCNCKGNCMNQKTCACAQLNGSTFPYVRNNGGRLTEAKDVVFECGPNCGCGPDCINRISQEGIKYHLEVFRTHDKGWAVRTRDFIPSGAPVCEYVGVLRQTDELACVNDNDYIFEIDCLHTIKGAEGRERRLVAVSGPLRDHLETIDDSYLEKTPEFCIDANSVGNVSRFINHSCEPNLFVQCVLSAHHDAKLARIVLFASEGIAPMQELTYDYGCPLDSVIGPDGKVKQQPCYCGTADCRKRLY